MHIVKSCVRCAVQKGGHTRSFKQDFSFSLCSWFSGAPPPLKTVLSSGALLPRPGLETDGEQLNRLLHRDHDECYEACGFRTGPKKICRILSAPSTRISSRMVQ
jgi:hypothetical protein